MVTDFAYDPERALWRPGRRSFLFMFGAAAVGSLVPAPGMSQLRYDVLIGAPTRSVALVTPAWVTRQVARDFINEISFVKTFNREYADPYVRDFDPIQPRLVGE